jgi:release factor glutamine methyltransferase
VTGSGPSTPGADTPPAFHDPVEPPPDGVPWTVLRLLRWSTGYLAEKGVVDGRLDVEHLLAHTLAMSRLDLYLHFERPLTAEELGSFKPLLLERAGRKPLQYILGSAAFRELELAVDERVLIPRPETEELVEAVLARVREWGREGLTALDVGTGSGAIALALLTEGPFQRILAVDRSGDALGVARSNARDLGLEAQASGRGVEFREGDLLDPVKPGERFDVVAANLPYVSEPEHKTLEPEVRRWEPRDALVAPDEGMALLRRLVEGAPAVLVPGGLLALEVGAGQAREVARLVDRTPELGAPVILRDLSRRDRIVLATREEA